jgi:uncharacterized repeat protein (TIGR03803 family)
MHRHGHALLAVLLASAGIAGFAANASASHFKVLYSFCHGGKFVCSDGKTPAANVIHDGAGNLYGTTSAGGATGNGVIFKLSPSGNRYTYQVLHSFDGAAEGGVPATSLIIDAAGNLYGTATADGANFGGTAFELSPVQDGSWTYKVLTNFCSQPSGNCVQGMVPESPLTYTEAASGKPYDGFSPLYGTTLEGGANGVGAVYQLTNSGGNWSGSTIYSFCSAANCADGQFPIGQLGLDASGNLYGTTNAGGTNNNGAGVAYKLVTASGAESVIHNFCSEVSCADGSNPLPGVTLDDKTLFGATTLGGKHGSGTVYQLNPATGKEKVFYSFCRKTGCKDGIGPVGPVIEYGGALLGAAGGGDASSSGVIYRVGVSNDETVLHTFCQQPACTDGAVPLGVVVDRAGNLFGTTQRGGKRNDGVVFELTP